MLIAWGPLGVLAVAFIESAGVPSPSGADALILLVTIARPEDWWLSALLAIIGSVSGSFVFFELVHRAGEKFLRRYTASPRGAKLRRWFERYGLGSVFVCALVPFPFMPLKVMAVCACALGIARWKYITTIAAARIPRYLAIGYLGSRLGAESSDWLREHVWQMGVAALVLLAVISVVLRFTDTTRVKMANPVPEPERQ
jgi:membrane protein YqaA with SNARE-associated domain